MFVDKPQYNYFLAFLLAFVAADVVVNVLIRAAARLGAVDLPRGYKSHTRAVPFLGGVGIFASTAFTLFVAWGSYKGWHFSWLDAVRMPEDVEGRRFFGVVAGAFLVLLVGLVDDYKPINAAVKLTILFVATLVLSETGVMVSVFGEWRALNLVCTLFWISGVVSALNSYDNTDGGSGGTAFITCVFTFLIAWSNTSERSQWWLAHLAIILAGAALGFLRHNFHPAKVFLGDNGSFSLGFFLGAMTIFGGWSRLPERAAVIPFLLVGMPIFDIILATVLRYKNRVVKSFYDAIVYCGRDHVAHRLMALGLSKVRAVLVMYALQACLCATALLLNRFESAITDLAFWSVIASVLALLFLFGAVLDRAPVYPPAAPVAVPGASPAPVTARLRPQQNPFVAEAAAATIDPGAGDGNGNGAGNGNGRAVGERA
ncbi:MAG: undecaprenyl/decaprenyl-phosphate alpha-N-acetylglucosaminyl 1-phosphate transferase [Planctomycetes bacterium]|nr:undecaprenyl/decaprenyl-phosphate alpha-N-acetylglucosaminyl 1-phosphate transferase [Planctomycetota bacterium]